MYGKSDWNMLETYQAQAFEMPDNFKRYVLFYITTRVTTIRAASLIIRTDATLWTSSISNLKHLKKCLGLIVLSMKAVS